MFKCLLGATDGRDRSVPQEPRYSSTPRTTSSTDSHNFLHPRQLTPGRWRSRREHPSISRSTIGKPRPLIVPPAETAGPFGLPTYCSIGCIATLWHTSMVRRMRDPKFEDPRLAPLYDPSTGHVTILSTISTLPVSSTSNRCSMWDAGRDRWLCASRPSASSQPGSTPRKLPSK